MMDQRQLRRLLSKAADGVASESERTQIAEALAANPTLRTQYVRFAQTEAALEHACLSEPPTSPEVMLGGAAATPSAVSPPVAARFLQTGFAKFKSIGAMRSWGGFALAASIAVIGVGVGWKWWSDCAAVISLEEVAWVPGNYFVPGESLGREWIELESGKIVVGFNSSALIEVRGPARFKAAGRNSCQLDYGSVLAYVPEDATGFSLDAPEFKVVDLGTSFRVQVLKDHASSIQVLEGVVSVTSKADGKTRQLTAGLVVNAASGGAAKLLGSQELAPVTSDRVVYRSKHVPSLGRKGLKVDDRCFLFLENSALRLPHDVSLNAAVPGRHTRFDGGEGIVRRGEQVRSYLLHCAPSAGATEVQGEITFKHPIVGVISSSDKLNATNSLFGSPWSLVCEDSQRGLESAPNNNADFIEILGDRRTLRFRLRTEAIDQLRILVRIEHYR